MPPGVGVGVGWGGGGVGWGVFLVFTFGELHFQLGCDGCADCRKGLVLSGYTGLEVAPQRLLTEHVPGEG